MIINQRKFIITLIVRFSVLFTGVILLLSVAGIILSLVNSKETGITKLFAYENLGLPYSYLLVLALFVLIITLLSFFVEYLIKRNNYK
jgi:hypothetical protein